MIITIAGKPGSGKSTVAKLLAYSLKLKIFSAGDLRGEIARQNKMTIEELNELGKTARWTDDACDKLMEKMGKEEDNIVFEGRLAWYFVPNSIKVFLDVDLAEAAKRIFNNPRSDEQKARSIGEMLAHITKRMNDDRERYKKWYNVDYLDLKKYDLVIDTTKITAQEAADQIVRFVKTKKNKN